MRNFALIALIAGSFGLTTISASARDYAQWHAGQYNLGTTFAWPWSHRLGDEINHLNRMRGHVRWLFRNYRSQPPLRRDFFAVSHEIDRINDQFKQGKFDRRQLRRDVEHAHAELHRIEVELHAKPRDYYPWR